MTRERLIELMDLVLECQRFGANHRARLEVDNDGDHQVYFYPYVGGRKTSTVYYCDEERQNHLSNFEYDPNFEAAEKAIRALLEAIPEEKETP